MKKVLSIILAAALLISLIPTAFAVVDEVTGLNTITYNFNYGTLGLTADEETALGDNALTLAWIMTNRTWVVGTDVYPTDAWTVKNFSGFNSTQATKNEFKLVGTKNKGNSYVLLSVNIDEAGIYVPSIKQNIPAEGRRGKYNVYFFSAADLEDKELTAESSCADIADVMAPANGENPIDVKTDPEKEEIQFGEYVVSEKSDDAAQYVLLEVYPSPLSTGKSDDQVWVKSLCFKQIGKIETEPEPEPEEPVDDGKLVYGFNAESTENGSDPGTGITIVKGDYTKSVNGGFWQYVATNFKNANIYGSFIKCTAKDDHNASPETPVYLTLEINVDKAGTYTPSIECENRSRGGHLKIYLVEEESYNGFENVYSSKTPLDNKYIETYTSDTASYKVHSFKNVTLNAGTYYLIFAVDGINSAATDTAQEHIKNFTLTPVEGGLDGSVTFFADANVSGADIDVNIAYSQGDVGSVARGKYVKVTANPLEGYIFRGWVRGSADNGIWVSSEEEYGFTAMTHTMLTAVYEAVAEGNVVEYYNENGTYLETKAAEEAAPSAPALVGYEFDNWYVNNDTLLSQAVLGELTRAVAKHTVKADTFDVEVESGIEIAVDGAYTYDKEVTLTAGKEVYWLRDGKVVDYGTSYTFNVWGDTSITTSETGNDLPKVILDEVVKGEARMIEYDNAGYEIVEVGIIFGNGASVEIGSCEEKMVSQRNLSHGQFTASSDYSVARGYIIYKNINGGLEIIYAD